MTMATCDVQNLSDHDYLKIGMCAFDKARDPRLIQNGWFKFKDVTLHLKYFY